MIVVAIAVYLVGYRAGFSAAERVGTEARQAPLRTDDPLLAGTARQGSVTAAGSIGPEGAGNGTQARALASDGSLGPPPLGEPRSLGLNYLTIASEIRSDLAVEMVAFCRGLGLDAVAIPSHNARLQVFVLPGFGWDDRGGAPVKALEAKIRAVGAKWKALGRGNSDFRGFYPILFKGSS